MSNKSIGLSEALQEYLLTHSLREEPVLHALREETARLPQANMQIAPEQGQFIRLLLRLMGASSALEIGVFTGYSTLCAALEVGDAGKVHALDLSEEWTSIAQRYWQEAAVADRIELHLAPALETLERLQGTHRASFDYAFIDADKENYLAYYEHALELVRPGGLIVLDNVLWSGDVADPAIEDPETVAIREVNGRLASDERVDLSMIPLADGLSLARRRP